ncbi:DNA-binding transcriptional ArsR family regulator [Methanofollis sp. W23]|uniref:ArsR/SmtB family transcription factor n=1 Tax=Methanofollis sp. W23 TaxID=2817849 RepID=UPI001AE58EB4|nr:helix-turn-helix domain-containing protein [Methanofollis sp. W23]MBP2145582.1 DNA-binding transcriptional ArsR family regulator [Methanofollis sp. W23]
MSEEVVVLEPGDEQAKKIAKAMASQTANDILGSLKDGPKSATEIAAALSIPITTLKYHVENLAEAGLIEIVKTKWSSKGREVKIYGLTERLLIVAPQVKDIKSVLLKFMSLFGFVVLATLVVAVLLPLLAPAPEIPDQAPRMMAAYDGASTAAEGVDNGMMPDSGPDPRVVAFFFGGTAVILLLLLYEVYLYFSYYRKRKRKTLD